MAYRSLPMHISKVHSVRCTKFLNYVAFKSTKTRSIFIIRTHKSEGLLLAGSGNQTLAA